MSYQIPYEADFECPKGHKFTASPEYAYADDEEVEVVKPPNVIIKPVICPDCYREFIEANVPKGIQIGEARQVGVVWRNM